MRKLKMLVLTLAAAALGYQYGSGEITSGQWKSEVFRTAGTVSDWLVRETASIRDSETAHFIASLAVKGRDSIRDTYAAQALAGWARSGTDASRNGLNSNRPWTDSPPSLQELQALAQDTRPAEVISPAQPETVLEGRTEAASAPTAPSAATRHSLGSNEVAASMALARSKIEQGDIAAARRLIERASASNQPQTWLALAETYDPQKLAQWGVLGVKPDREKAKFLYEKAKALGDQSARERLLALAN